MRFTHLFSRFLGAGTLATKQLGQAGDLAPNTAGPTSVPLRPSDAVDNVLITKFANTSGWPLQRIAIGYSYAGAGSPPATFPGCALWLWDTRTERWYRMPSTFTLTRDQITLSDIVALMDGGARSQAETFNPSSGGLEAWLSVPDPGGSADGEYRFILGADMSTSPP